MHEADQALHFLGQRKFLYQERFTYIAQLNSNTLTYEITLQ